jgi:hypothetical protein
MRFISIFLCGGIIDDIYNVDAVKQTLMLPAGTYNIKTQNCLTRPWYYQPAISDPFQSEALRRKFFGNARSADPVLVRATRDSNFWQPSHCTVCIKH